MDEQVRKVLVIAIVVLVLFIGGLAALKGLSPRPAAQVAAPAIDPVTYDPATRPSAGAPGGGPR